MSADELQQWIAEARAHWREFRPELYRGLKARGTLEERLKEPAQKTQIELDSLTKAGLPHNQAWEMVREEYLFLPENSPAMKRRAAQRRRDPAPHEANRPPNVSRDALRRALTGE